jgi:hypothetical protein
MATRSVFNPASAGRLANTHGRAIYALPELPIQTAAMGASIEVNAQGRKHAQGCVCVAGFIPMTVRRSHIFGDTSNAGEFLRKSFHRRPANLHASDCAL